jgi:HK97 family phage major capsid protein
VIVDDLIDLMFSVDPLYRASPSAAFLMADSTLKFIRKIKTATTNEPIFLPASRPGQPDMLLGKPVIVSDDVAAMAANAKSIIFGDLSQYMIRDAAGVGVLRLQERFAEVGQVAFIAFLRTDGRAINAGALRYYQNSSS